MILGIDFLQKYNLVLDFTSTPVGITSKAANELETLPKCMKHIVDSGRKAKSVQCKLLRKQLEKPLILVQFHYLVDIPTCTNTMLLAVLEQHKKLFNTTPGHTKLAEHFIPTTGTCVKVPPHRIPANYRAEVEEQIQAMLKEGIIKESSSPWMSSAMFVQKKWGCPDVCRLLCT